MRPFIFKHNTAHPTLVPSSVARLIIPLQRRNAPMPPSPAGRRQDSPRTLRLSPLPGLLSLRTSPISIGTTPGNLVPRRERAVPACGSLLPVSSGARGGPAEGGGSPRDGSALGGRPQSGEVEERDGFRGKGRARAVSGFWGPLWALGSVQNRLRIIRKL